MAGTLRLRGRMLLKLGRGPDESLLAISQISRVSYPTILRYLTKPEEVQNIDLSVLANILIDGLGLSPNEVMEMQLKDLFEYIRK